MLVGTSQLSIMNRYSLVFCLLSISINFVAETVARLEGEGIRGGETAEKDQFPYQVSLQIFGTNVCGGVIVDKRYVVAAAHCVYTTNDRFVSVPMKIVAGVNYLGTSENRVMMNVAEVFVPKEYDPHVRPYYSAIGDISVLKLQRDLDFEEYPNIAEINLPKSDETYENVEAIVAGFGYNKIEVFKDPKTGKLEEDGSSDGKLRFAKTNVLANSDCDKLFKGPIYGEHLCARVDQRDPEVPRGICSGDSGSPLIYKNTLIGVATASPLGCSEKKEPGIYVRVSKYVNFIEKVINGQIDENIRSDSLPVFG